MKVLYFMAVEFSDYEYTYMGFFEVWNHVLFDYISHSWIIEWKKQKVEWRKQTLMLHTNSI